MKRDTVLSVWFRVGPVFLWMIPACFIGCGDSRPAADVEAPGTSGTSRPERIICGSPAVAEIVFALGCSDRVVGVSDYTVFPPEAAAKPSIGGWINPNRERLLVLKPDIIISQGEHETLAAFCSTYDIRFFAVKLDTLGDIRSAVTSIAEALEVRERGESLNGRIRDAVQAVREKTETLELKRVLILLGRASGELSGLGTVGPGTFLDAIVRVAGGSNVFCDAKGAYPQISKESLLVRRPDVILEINAGGVGEETLRRLRSDWKEFSELPAVRDDRIHFLTNDYLLMPGPRVGLVAETFARAIHPEAFREMCP